MVYYIILFYCSLLLYIILLLYSTIFELFYFIEYSYMI